MSVTVKFSDYMKACGSPNDVHVLPVDDLRDHRETRACWCEPSVARAGRGSVIVHNSADGRELVERHGLQ